jgi:hypothetical protein
MPCFILTLFVRANRYLPCIRALKSERTRAIHDNGLMALHALKAIRDVYFHGDMEAAPALAGQSAGLIDKIKSAQQIIEETVAQFFAITPTRPASPQSAQHFLPPKPPYRRGWRFLGRRRCLRRRFVASAAFLSWMRRAVT